MIDLKKYCFRKHSKEYNLQFSREKAKLKNLFPGIQIEHVGSTAVPGLGGKGMVDIAVKTPKSKINLFVRKLEKLGFKSSFDHARDQHRVFLQRRINYGGKERRVHVHLVFDNYYWNTFIVVRDYLRKHRDACEEYARVKKEAIKYAKGEGKEYRKYKRAFLERIQRKAFKEFSK